MTVLTADGAAMVAEVRVAVGDLVPKGGVLIATELMKMRHEILAPENVRIMAVHVAVGDELHGGMALVSFEAAQMQTTVDAKPDVPRPEFIEFENRMGMLHDSARPDAVAKRHAGGYRTARENIEDLFDAETFNEYGALAVAAQRTRKTEEELQAKAQADGIICGTGLINGRPVAAMAVDYMVMAGTQGYQHHRKMDRLIEVAGRDRLPIVLFAEGGGGRPNDVDVDPLIAAGLNVPSFRNFAAHKGPKIGIVAGYCFAGNAALFGVCDLRIATKNSWVGMGGPAMIEGGGLGRFAAKDIGPSDLQMETGLIDLRVEDERSAVLAAKQVLGMSDTASWQNPDADLRDIVPSDRTRAYDMRRAIAGIVDDDSFLELRQKFGDGIITGFARVKGRPLGLLANNPLHLGGAIDAQAGDKAARFLQLCDAWGLPVLTLCDTPGFMVGPEVEATGQVAHVSRLFLAGAHFSQPLVTVILRKAYGLGAMAMAGGGFDRPQFCCAWPTGELGAMGIEGAVKLGARDHLAAIEDDQAREAELQRLIDALYARGKALNAASVLEFDAVIDPADTRHAVDRAFATAGAAVPGHRYVDAW
ncbi:carboxyl transferase domain-containing protein [Ascidiaceihabitans sp.]|uniref:carboxyl transferase domain-containing protein n=1 Tax=Ascidiaceihabitans sp. TaxID=1872644 RepID=UPI0032971772